MLIALHAQSFDPYTLLSNYTQQQEDLAARGACSIFIGNMRDHHEPDNESKVDKMFIEHYPGMTEKQLENIYQAAKTQWNLLDGLIIHRVGDILPGEAIVIVASWSTHRNAACEATRHMIEQLKSTAPFWKKEWSAEQTSWVSNNTKG